MKRKPDSSRSYTFEGIALYREDLEEIMTTLRSRGFTVALSDWGFEYENLDEVEKQVGTRPRALYLEASMEGRPEEVLALKCRYKSVQLSYSGGPLSQAEGLALYSLFDDRPERLWRRSNPAIWALVCLLTVGPTVAIEVIHRTGDLSWHLPRWAIGLAALPLIPWIAGAAYRRGFTSARLSYRHKGGFWARHRDSIILLAIGAALGVIGSYVAKLVGSK